MFAFSRRGSSNKIAANCRVTMHLQSLLSGNRNKAFRVAGKVSSSDPGFWLIIIYHNLQQPG